MVHASLHSDDEDPGTFDDGVDGAEHQADDDSWDSNVNAQARVQGGAATDDHDGDNLDCRLLSTSNRSELKLAKLLVASIRTHTLSRLELLPAPGPLIMSTTSSIGTHVHPRQESTT